MQPGRAACNRATLQPRVRLAPLRPPCPLVPLRQRSAAVLTALALGPEGTATVQPALVTATLSALPPATAAARWKAVAALLAFLGLLTAGVGLSVGYRPAGGPPAEKPAAPAPAARRAENLRPTDRHGDPRRGSPGKRKQSWTGSRSERGDGRKDGTFAVGCPRGTTLSGMDLEEGNEGGKGPRLSSARAAGPIMGMFSTELSRGSPPAAPMPRPPGRCQTGSPPAREPRPWLAPARPGPLPRGAPIPGEVRSGGRNTPTDSHRRSRLESRWGFCCAPAAHLETASPNT
jgi:hypothetical protein